MSLLFKAPTIPTKKFLYFSLLFHVLIAHNGQSQIEPDTFRKHWDTISINPRIIVNKRIVYVEVDTLLKYRQHLRADSMLLEENIYFNHYPFYACSKKSYMKSGNTSELIEWAATYDYPDSSGFRYQLRGTSVSYWDDGVISIVGYNDPKGLKQGNQIECERDGSIKSNKLFKDGILVKTYLYNESGELIKVVEH